MSDDQSGSSQPRERVPRGEAMSEFLVSAPNTAPSHGAARLQELVETVAGEDGVSVVKTIPGRAGVSVVVLSSTPLALQKVAIQFPDLTIEKNSPLALF